MVFDKKYFIKKKVYNNKIIKRDNIVIPVKISSNYKTYYILIPSEWTCTIFKSRITKMYILYFLNSFYFYKTTLPLTQVTIRYDFNLNVLSFSNYKISSNLNLWVKNTNSIISLFTMFFFSKIKFKGKGYYIYKNKRNTITPQFGYSHRIYMYSYFNIVKFLTKTKVLIFGFLKKDILITAHNIKSKRPINIFTGRGVRFASQVIYKKTGKVSSYR